MITAIKANNVNAYKKLFEEATDVLSGFKEVRTYSPNTEYFYKAEGSREIKPFNEEFFKDNTDDTQRVLIFADAMAIRKFKMYTQFSEKPLGGFSPELGITSLEEYYSWLPLIKSEGEGENKVPTKFTILPVINNSEEGKKVADGEDPFIINANTRAINIPNDFKKNGIAVQGDDVAEVVYFKIDRYFDAMDLSNCEIYIQWEIPKGSKNDANEQLKGISKPYIVDLSQNGYIIFGWAISEAITVNSGTLKFSVRFIDRDEVGKIAYSLNTLTAQVAIQPSIGIDLKNGNYIPDDAADRLLERIQAGEIVGGLRAATPYYIENLAGTGVEYDIQDNPYDGTFEIAVLAKSDDTGEISYTWKKYSYDDNGVLSQSHSEPVNSKIAYVAVNTDNAGYPILLEGHTYYYYASDGDKEPTAWEGSYTKDALDVAFNGKAIPTFYEQKAVFEVTEAGVYKADARNRIFNSISVAESEAAIFPFPDKVIFADKDKESEAPQTGFIIGKEGKDVLAPSYNDESIGGMKYKWRKYADFRPASLSHGIAGGIFDSTRVAYGENAIKICYAKNTEYFHQAVGEGGDSNTFYVGIKTYVPEGAVKLSEFRNGQGYNIGTGAEKRPLTLDDIDWNDPTVYTMTIGDTSTEWDGGEDEKGVYRLNWRGVATYDENTQAWTPYVPTEADQKYGYSLVHRWEDAEGNYTYQMTKLALINPDFNNFDSFTGEYVEFETETPELSLTEDKGEGMYQAVFTRTRNRRNTSGNTTFYRVTLPTEAPKASYGPEAEHLIPIKELQQGSAALTVKLDETVKYDRYLVHWCHYRGDEDKEDILVVTHDTGDTVDQFNPFDYKFVFDEIEEGISGRYYAVVQTIRNEDVNPVYVDEKAIFNARPALTSMFSVIGDIE